MVTERIYRRSGGDLYIQEQTIEELAAVYERPTAPVNAQHRMAALPELRELDEFATENWMGGISHHKQAVELVRRGWVDGEKRLGSLREELSIDVPAAKSRRRRPRWGDDGDTLDVDRALLGRWDSAFRTTERAWTVGSSVVDIYVGWGGNVTKLSDDLFWSGAQMLVLTDVLEEAGYSVRLTAAACIQQGNDTACLKVLLKEAGETLRIDALAGVVCHAGVFRTMGFRAILSSHFNVQANLGYTVKAHIMKERLAENGEWPGDENAMFVPHAYNRETALANIRAALGIRAESEAA